MKIGKQSIKLQIFQNQICTMKNIKMGIFAGNTSSATQLAKNDTDTLESISTYLLLQMTLLFQ